MKQLSILEKITLRQILLIAERIILLRAFRNVTSCKGRANTTFKGPRARVFISKSVFVSFGVSQGYIMSKNMTITLYMTHFKCKNLPATQDTTSTGGVRSKILLSAIDATHPSQPDKQDMGYSRLANPR